MFCYQMGNTADTYYSFLLVAMFGSQHKINDILVQNHRNTTCPTITVSSHIFSNTTTIIDHRWKHNLITGKLTPNHRSTASVWVQMISIIRIWPWYQYTIAVLRTRCCHVLSSSLVFFSAPFFVPKYYYLPISSASHDSTLIWCNQHQITLFWIGTLSSAIVTT